MSWSRFGVSFGLTFRSAGFACTPFQGKDLRLDTMVSGDDFALSARHGDAGLLLAEGIQRVVRVRAYQIECTTRSGFAVVLSSPISVTEELKLALSYGVPYEPLHPNIKRRVDVTNQPV